MQPVNKNSTATEEELEQHVMVGEMVSLKMMSTVKPSQFSYIFSPACLKPSLLSMSLYLFLSVSEYDDKLDPQRDRCS
jgi:hypothetical protein